PSPTHFLVGISDGKNFVVRPPFQVTFLAKASPLPPLPSPPLFSDRKPTNGSGNNVKNWPKLPTSPATFPATVSCAVAWNRYSDHAYAARGTLSGSSNVGLLVSGHLFSNLMHGFMMGNIMHDVSNGILDILFIQVLKGRFCQNFGRESRGL
ncbi:hypothetical protein Prudu_016962, partial [Prunus dulcis]